MTYPAAPGGLLTVHRPVEVTYAARSYKIYVDGAKVESVGVRSSVEIWIPAGRHVLKAKIDWCSSPELVIDVVPGERMVLQVYAAGMFYEKLINQVFRPSQFLALQPAQA